MAPIGSVIKNGIIFAVISVVAVLFAAQRIAAGLVLILTFVNTNEAATLNQGATQLFVGLLILVLGPGIGAHFTLSSVVEDGIFVE